MKSEIIQTLTFEAHAQQTILPTSGKWSLSKEKKAIKKPESL